MAHLAKPGLFGNCNDTHTFHESVPKTAHMAVPCRKKEESFYRKLSLPFFSSGNLFPVQMILGGNGKSTSKSPSDVKFRFRALILAPVLRSSCRSNNLTTN